MHYEAYRYVNTRSTWKYNELRCNECTVHYVVKTHQVTFTSTSHVVEDIELLKEMKNENELKIKQERSDLQDANNHSTKLHQDMCISAATSILLMS